VVAHNLGNQTEVAARTRSFLDSNRGVSDRLSALVDEAATDDRLLTEEHTVESVIVAHELERQCRLARHVPAILWSNLS
jgi:hypothetical protein